MISLRKTLIPLQKSNPLWDLVRDILHNRSAVQSAFQEPKTSPLDVGSVDMLYAWAPNIVDIKVFHVGQSLIIIFAGEASPVVVTRFLYFPWRQSPSLI